MPDADEAKDGVLVSLGCGIAGLRSLHDAKASLILTDLPSGETRASFDSPIELAAFWPAAWDALYDAGVVVLMASSLRFAAKVMASQESHFLYDLVWHKSLATGHLNASRRPLRAHEHLLVFSRARKITYHPQRSEGASPIHAARRASNGENYNVSKATRSRAGATDRMPVSVLEFASVGTSSAARTHPQQKPEPMLRWLIRTFTGPGQVVVDPFAGSGSTGRAAAAELRRFRGWDSSPRFGQ